MHEAWALRRTSGGLRGSLEAKFLFTTNLSGSSVFARKCPGHRRRPAVPSVSSESFWPDSPNNADIGLPDLAPELMPRQDQAKSDQEVQTAPYLASSIGQPVHFATGPFKGRQIRAELVELQKADLGRKCGSRDRRPLDPPPVVRLRLFETRQEGSSTQSEREVHQLTEFENHGFVCHVDLFPVPSTPLADLQNNIPPWTAPSYHRPGRNSPVSSLADSLIVGPSRPLGPVGETAGTSMAIAPSATNVLTDVVATHLDGVPIMESSRCTEDLVGTTFAASSCFEYRGINQLMFIFSDLAVKMDGCFFLRYRAFNTLFSVKGNVPVPILAECFGGMFRIYSTKDFPGLSASTDLTKHISQYGARVNAREHERKRRKSSHIVATSTVRQRELAVAPAPPKADTLHGSNQITPRTSHGPSI